MCTLLCTCMNTKTTMSISEARKKIFQIADEVQKPNIHYTLTEKGRPKVVVMSAEEFESWQETLEVMKDFPDLAEDLKAAEEEYKRGETITFDELLAKEGYALQNIDFKKSRKGTGKNRKEVQV